MADRLPEGCTSFGQARFLGVVSSLESKIQGLSAERATLGSKRKNSPNPEGSAASWSDLCNPGRVGLPSIPDTQGSPEIRATLGCAAKLLRNIFVCILRGPRCCHFPGLAWAKVHATESARAAAKAAGAALTLTGWEGRRMLDGVGKSPAICELRFE